MPENIRVAIDNRRVLAAFEKAPRTMVKNVRRFLSRAAFEVGDEAKRNVPQALSTLVKAIGPELDPIPALSARVIAGANYARYVEEGTGPGGVPPRETLRAWLRAKRIEPRTPGADEDDLIFLIQRKISRHGTPAQPYMVPALEKKRSRVFDLINQGVEKGIAEAFK